MGAQRRKVAVVGAGPGGLAAAMILAFHGIEVDIYEKKPYLGGRCSPLELGDYRFDLGPTFLMMPHQFEQLFASVGKQLHDYVSLTEVDPLYRLQFGGLRFAPSRDRQYTREQIDMLFPGNGEGYDRFMREQERVFEHALRLLSMPFHGLRDVFRPEVLSSLLRIRPIGSVYGRLSNYFRDERLIQAFSFQTKYLGMSAWECPATFTILSYLEHRYGLVHPQGGVHQICRAMGEIILEYGGCIHLAEGVSRIVVRNGKACGIELENGEKLQYDDVVVNADFGTAVTRLFEPGVLKKYAAHRIERLKLSCSTFMLYLGIDRRIDLPHHTVYFAGNYRNNVEDITQRKVLSDDFSVYVHNPCRIDPTMAPPGKTALYVLMPVPNMTGMIDWEQEKRLVRERILDRLEQEPELRGIRSAIECEQMISPMEWQNDIHVYKGAAFNLAHTLDQMMWFRPRNRFEEVERCWLVGGGTHPGSGLPTIVESAKITTGLLLGERR